MAAIVDKELIKKSIIDLATIEPTYVSVLMVEIDAELKKNYVYRNRERGF